ncbi:hypothetical protein CEW87_03535 [Parazoarcus communis]|uniref:Uncharacterized protein n=1 Tax=Parazoarcus communis TaxID=41977 RepID=A0A2U8GXR9_9RHOO|nr:hypothetical protein CEW87_03535 [Parazoarcus communis]
MISVEMRDEQYVYRSVFQRIDALPKVFSIHRSTVKRYLEGVGWSWGIAYNDLRSHKAALTHGHLTSRHPCF